YCASVGRTSVGSAETIIGNDVTAKTARLMVAASELDHVTRTAGSAKRDRRYSFDFRARGGPAQSKFRCRVNLPKISGRVLRLRGDCCRYPCHHITLGRDINTQRQKRTEPQALRPSLRRSL